MQKQREKCYHARTDPRDDLSHFMNNLIYAPLALIGVSLMTWCGISLYRGHYYGNLYKVEKSKLPNQFYTTILESFILALILICIAIMMIFFA